jgi:hypothetical protein
MAATVLTLPLMAVGNGWRAREVGDEPPGYRRDQHRVAGGCYPPAGCLGAVAQTAKLNLRPDGNQTVLGAHVLVRCQREAMLLKTTTIARVLAMARRLRHRLLGPGGCLTRAVSL